MNYPAFPLTYENGYCQPALCLDEAAVIEHKVEVGSQEHPIGPRRKYLPRLECCSEPVVWMTNNRYTDQLASSSGSTNTASFSARRTPSPNHILHRIIMLVVEDSPASQLAGRPLRQPPFPSQTGDRDLFEVFLEGFGCLLMVTFHSLVLIIAITPRKVLLLAKGSYPLKVPRRNSLCLAT